MAKIKSRMSTATTRPIDTKARNLIEKTTLAGALLLFLELVIILLSMRPNEAYIVPNTTNIIKNPIVKYLSACVGE
ncbi:hypothetical protein DFA_01665 [Cavenderia fasciculata]|uniref:Uncharacterized protein n=1 Tax=Cavenderia fasciculata TaxID=261658 RepID=F4PU11_CACFS|nr:uncharacterized protein DFA_01665 [Cavenderia fasciculata]EGG21779.1 hypothetical protein DFA_01665 [Cavenderia fasciculata]|eukprot:XP_004359629.1 hypothetical protein DFA_01665 [Cavenderia fasciculata]